MNSGVRILVLIVGIAVLASGATGRAPEGFRTLKWGAPPGAGLRKLPGGAAGTTMYGPPAGRFVPLFGMTVSQEAYFFTAGRFSSASVWLDGAASIATARSALMREYGVPSLARESDGVWVWQWPGNRIEVQLSYQSRAARTTITFVNRSIAR